MDCHEDGSRSESAVHHDSEDAEYIAMEERDDRDDEGCKERVRVERRREVSTFGVFKKSGGTEEARCGRTFGSENAQFLAFYDVPEILRIVKMTQYANHVAGKQWKV